MRRLAVISVVALGLIFALWARTGHSSALIGIGLAAGWVLMPSMLVLSLRWPAIRYGLALPSTLGGLALLAFCLSSPAVSLAARIGWWQIFAGVVMGGVLGGWFWFRWLPVPAQLNDPFSIGRWALIAVHAGLIVAGVVLVAVG